MLFPWGWLIYIFILILALCATIIIVFTLVNGIGPTPSTHKARNKLIGLLPHEVNGKIGDFGSGWGGVLVDLSKKYPKNTIVGFENSPIPWIFTIARIKLLRLNNVKIEFKDFCKAELIDFGLIYCYLNIKQMKRLEYIILDHLSHCYLIANTFSLRGVRHTKKVSIVDILGTELFFYGTVSSTKKTK